MVKSREEETGLPSYKELLRRKEMDDGSISVSEKAIIEAIERANKAVQLVDTSFEFSIHEKTRQIMVKVLNRETKEVIREIPPEKILDMVAKIWEMAGIIVDERR
ncbi:MAG: flagellar protein FlaG [Clostridiaceae bacterium]|nr:flagellar protein FlaG [Clostridiaceae bacterium]